MKIKNIKFLSEEAQEVVVILSDGNFSLTCFSQPFSGKITFPLQLFWAKNLIISENKNFSCEKIGNYEYFINACIVDFSEKIVKLWEFLLQLDEEIFKDVKNGDFVSFSCERIDIW